MKALQILTHLNIGGIPTYVYTISKYLIRNDIEIAVASSGGVWEDNFKKLGIKTFRIPIKTKSELSPKIPLTVHSLYKIKKEFNFDLIHSHTRVTQVASQIFSNLTHTPHIANFHGFYEKNRLRLGRKIFKAQGDLSIAITPQVKNDLVNTFDANKTRVKTIISGIDLETLDDKVGGLELAGYPKIGATGRLSSIKGFKYLVESLPAVLNKYPKAHLYIMGKGDEEKNLMNLAKELKIENHFSIIKDVNLVSFLKSLDLFCLPSLEEPLGLSVVEAQYFGIPCVASDVGGLRITVDNMNTGIGVPPKNPEEISKALILLMGDPDLRNKISMNSKRQVVENFDIEKKIDSFISVYKKAMEKA